MKSTSHLRMMVYASLFAALTAAGAFLAISIGPVPIALQNLFVSLAGLLLGSRWGVWSVAIYLLTGVLGLPIFAGGTAGIAKLAGPTGGYLLGYLPAVFVIGFLSEKLPKKPLCSVLAMIAGALIVYAGGVPWLKSVTGMTWSNALTAGLYPFLPGDALKIAAAVPIFRLLKEYIRLPGKQVATMMSLMVRFLPVIMKQARETSAAQQCRCIQNRKNPVYRTVKFSLPLLCRTLETADQLADAMEARC